MSIKAKMLNHKASLSKFKAGKIIEVLNIQKGAVIADIGSGGGYFTFLFAEKVGSAGKVFAVDTDAKLLAFINNHANKNQLTNIETILVRENISLEGKSCDLIFLRNVFHHIEQPESYFRNLKSFLKANGRVVIIDYRKPAKRSFISLPRHYAEEEVIQEVMKDARYNLVERYDFLPEQSFNVFQLELS